MNEIRDVFILFVVKYVNARFSGFASSENQVSE